MPARPKATTTDHTLTNGTSNKVLGKNQNRKDCDPAAEGDYIVCNPILLSSSSPVMKHSQNHLLKTAEQEQGNLYIFVKQHPICSTI
jgi:hypothetical protein